MSFVLEENILWNLYDILRNCEEFAAQIYCMKTSVQIEIKSDGIGQDLVMLLSRALNRHWRSCSVRRCWPAAAEQLSWRHSSSCYRLQYTKDETTYGIKNNQKLRLPSRKMRLRVERCDCESKDATASRKMRLRVERCDCESKDATVSRKMRLRVERCDCESKDATVSQKMRL